MTSISKAHMRDEISSNLLSWTYCCLFVVSILHIIKMHLNNPTTLLSSPKQGRLGAHSKKLSFLNFYGKQEAWTRNKPTLTYSNNNLTYWILVATRSRLSCSSHYDGSHFLTMNNINNNTWIYQTQVYEIHKQALKLPYDLHHFPCASNLVFSILPWQQF